MGRIELAESGDVSCQLTLRVDACLGMIAHDEPPNVLVLRRHKRNGHSAGGHRATGLRKSSCCEGGASACGTQPF
jgi:hypothetical protein